MQRSRRTSRQYYKGCLGWLYPGRLSDQRDSGSGEVNALHRGVLFLDELCEFPRAALEALRQPLESGEVTVVRSSASVRFPARFALVGAYV